MKKTDDTSRNQEEKKHTEKSCIGFEDAAMMKHKVQEDIRFLEDRIERINNLQTKNTTVLQTYQSMLAARKSVLSWLNENKQEKRLDKFG